LPSVIVFLVTHAQQRTGGQRAGQVAAGLWASQEATEQPWTSFLSRDQREIISSALCRKDCQIQWLLICLQPSGHARILRCSPSLAPDQIEFLVPLRHILACCVALVLRILQQTDEILALFRRRLNAHSFVKLSGHHRAAGAWSQRLA